jgi:hypothetical protein
LPKLGLELGDAGLNLLAHLKDLLKVIRHASLTWPARERGTPGPFSSALNIVA